MVNSSSKRRNWLNITHMVQALTKTKLFLHPLSKCFTNHIQKCQQTSYLLTFETTGISLSADRIVEIAIISLRRLTEPGKQTKTDQPSSFKHFHTWHHDMVKMPFTFKAITTK